MYKVLIIGSNGLIGNTISKFLYFKKLNLFCGLRNKEKRFSKNINFFYYNDLNKKSNFKKLLNNIKKSMPDFVINCCGITKHVNNYQNKTINYKLPVYLDKISNFYKFKLIHISTDCVFNGKIGNYNEFSYTSSLDNYGKIKALLEKKLIKSNKSLILRTSTIGNEINSKNGLLEWFLSEKGKVNGYTNAYFSGPTALELAKIIYRNVIIRQTLKNGIYNIASYKISKYNLLVLLNKVYNKKLLIYASSSIKINRSLNSKKFTNKTKYKKKKWINLIREMKKFNEKYF